MNLLNLLPTIIFFISYKFANIYFATMNIILSTLLLIFIFKIKTNQYQQKQIIFFVIILTLGGITLIFRNDIFIKWKTTITYFILCMTFLITTIIKKPIIKKILQNYITLPKKIWLTLNFSWAIFFLFISFINLYVMYNFNTNTWIHFKIFGILSLTILFIIIQYIYIKKFITENMNK